MEWYETGSETGRRWERADGNAVVSVRETATGDWSVTYDRLTQAPEGSAYRHRTVHTEADALAVAEEWRVPDASAEA